MLELREYLIVRSVIEYSYLRLVWSVITGNKIVKFKLLKEQFVYPPHILKYFYNAWFYREKNLLFVDINSYTFVASTLKISVFWQKYQVVRNMTGQQSYLKNVPWSPLSNQIYVPSN